MIRRVLLVYVGDELIGAYTNMENVAFYVPGVSASGLRDASYRRGFPLDYKGYRIERVVLNV